MLFNSVRNRRPCIGALRGYLFAPKEMSEVDACADWYFRSWSGVCFCGYEGSYGVFDDKIHLDSVDAHH